MRKKVFWVALGVFLGWLSTAQAQTVEQFFYEGNRLYSEGKYEEAAQKYNQALSLGRESAALYFNLGNCHAKLKQKGKAILFYEKARRMSPRDPELKYNLRFLQSQLEDKVTPQPGNLFLEKFWRGMERASQREWKVAFLVFYFIFLILSGSLLVLQKEWVQKMRLGLWIVGLLWGLMGFCLGAKAWQENQAAGIVTQSKVEARYGPTERDVVAFTLHEGTPCQILGAQGNFFQIRLADGKVAWLPTDSLSQI